MINEIAQDMNQVYCLEVLFAGKCNLKCGYCLIHKNTEKMNNYNQAIIKSVESGEFQKRIITKFAPSKELLEIISLWGAEPSLNSIYAQKLLEPLLDFFPNVKEIMFSTNAIIGFEKGLKPYYNFLSKYCAEHRRELKLTIQFSIDGPKEITDLSRNCPGATEKIVKSMIDTVMYHSDNQNNYLTLHMMTKPTVSPEQQEYLLMNNKVKEWYSFFDELAGIIDNLCPNKENLLLDIAQEPTICSPYDYTKKDGIIYRDFIRAIKKLDDSQFKYYKHPLIHRFMLSWHWGLAAQDYSGPAFLCNAGYTGTSVDFEGNIMTCHRVYDGYRSGGANYSEPAKSVQLVATLKDEYRINYLTKTYFLNHRFKMDIQKALTAALISAGEIDKKYLNIRYQRILTVLFGAVTCYAGECGFQTPGLYLTPLGRLRLLCNGALEEIVDYYERYL